MSLVSRILTIAAICMIGLSTAARARHRAHFVNSQMPSAPPVVTPAPSIGINTRGTNQPGVPNTSRPGTIGTGAVPSGLNGDSPTTPGFPGKVGRD